MNTTQDLQNKLAQAQVRIEDLERVINDKARALSVGREEVRSSKSYLEAVLDTILSVLIVTDEHLFITMANQAAARLLGLDKEQILGRYLCELFPLPCACALRDSVRISDLAEFHGEQLLQLPGESRSITAFTSISGLKMNSAEYSGLVIVVTDLTKYKELERQLSQAHRLESVGQLAAGLAHEINTPIQYVRDNSRFLSEEFSHLKDFLIDVTSALQCQGEISLPTKEVLHKKAEAIQLEYLLSEIPLAAEQTRQGADHVAKIVRSMKLFSHPGVKEKIKVDLNATLESTVTVSTNEWKYVADVELNLDPNLPQVFCEPAQLAQAFLNLIINSAHAISDNTDSGRTGKGKIGITTKLLNAGNIEVCISDNGKGIADQDLSKIFDPFFTTKGPGKGTGQGLAIVHTTIVKEHHGAIVVETAPGKGCCMRITLPVQQTA